MIQPHNFIFTFIWFESKKSVIVEYNIPSECGNVIFLLVFTCITIINLDIVVSYSPTPSTVKTTDSLNVDVKKNIPDVINDGSPYTIFTFG